MMVRIVGTLVLLHCILTSGNGCKKKDPNMAPIYHIHPNDTLPSDLQVTAWLLRNQPRRLFYYSPTDGGALSITLTTCTSSVLWSFAPNTTTPPPSIYTNVTTTHHLQPSKVTFVLSLLAQEADTFVHIYVSTEPGGPQALQKTKFAKVKLMKRQKGKRLTVKWNPSLVDPQGTEYCLVQSTDPLKAALCAQPSNTSVVCVGRKTHHTMTDLKQGQKYYFGVFAINHQSNFTYAYGTITTVFDGRFRHASLKDGKPTFANLKKLDGKAVFRYKVGENSTENLDLFILPCGGVIDVEVTLKDVTVVPPKRVESFGRVTIQNPVPSARYYIKIFALNREELKKTSGVEIYATTKYPSRIPLPDMPEIVKVTEYKSMTTCDSVTLGWMAAPTQKNVQYCLSAKEGKIREAEEYRMPNQCGLENRLKKSTDFAVKYCTDVKTDEKPVVLRTVSQLKPDRFYIIQVTVKKPKGKTLSYDLLQVRTKPSCKKKNK